MSFVLFLIGFLVGGGIQLYINLKKASLEQLWRESVAEALAMMCERLDNLEEEAEKRKAESK